jgi:hypothetical protein
MDYNTMGEMIKWLSNYNNVKLYISYNKRLPSIFELEHFSIFEWILINISNFEKRTNIMSDERFYNMFSNFLRNYKCEIKLFCDENVYLLCKYIEKDILKYFNNIYINMLLYSLVNMTINGKYNNENFNNYLYINSNIFNYLDHKTSYQLYCYLINNNNNNKLSNNIYDYLYTLPYMK